MAPAHFDNDARGYLNMKFDRRWVERGGPVRWPARSSDLIPIDFILWGQTKDVVCSTPMASEKDLVGRMAEAKASVLIKIYLIQLLI